MLALTDKADTLATYLFRHLSEGLDLNTVDGRARLARLALPFLDKPAGPVYRALLEEELARLTRLERSALEKLRESLPKPRRAAPEPPPAHPEPAPQDADPGPWDAPPPDDYPGPPPDWADSPDQQGAPARPPRRRAPRSSGGLTLVDRLVLVLLSHPEVLVEHPLPEGLDQLELEQRDLLLQVAATARDQTGSPAALLGAAMALDHGESLSALLREALKPPMDADVARRYWEDALGHLRIMALEQALEKEQRRPDPDAARLGELIQALSVARSKARQGFT